MYFLISGIMEVVAHVDTPEEEHYAILNEGDFFGEIAVFHHVRRTASVRAISYSSTFVMTRRSLDLISDCEYAFSFSLILLPFATFVFVRAITVHFLPCRGTTDCALCLLPNLYSLPHSWRAHPRKA